MNPCNNIPIVCKSSTHIPRMRTAKEAKQEKEINEKIFSFLIAVKNSDNNPSFRQKANEILSFFQLKPTSADRKAYFDALDNGEIE